MNEQNLFILLNQSVASIPAPSIIILPPGCLGTNSVISYTTLLTAIQHELELQCFFNSSYFIKTS